MVQGKWEKSYGKSLFSLFLQFFLKSSILIERFLPPQADHCLRDGHVRRLRASRPRRGAVDGGVRGRVRRRRAGCRLRPPRDHRHDDLAVHGRAQLPPGRRDDPHEALCAEPCGALRRFPPSEGRRADREGEVRPEGQDGGTVV